MQYLEGKIFPFTVKYIGIRSRIDAIISCISYKIGWNINPDINIPNIFPKPIKRFIYDISLRFKFNIVEPIFI